MEGAEGGRLSGEWRGSSRTVTGLKCRRCRQALVEDRKVVEGEDLFHIPDEDLPPWISQAIEQGGWTKGKLVCPSCQARVGGFDFVSRAVAMSPVHLVKSKVDPICPPVQTSQLLNTQQGVHELDQDQPQPLNTHQGVQELELDQPQPLNTDQGVQELDLAHPQSVQEPVTQQDSPKLDRSEDGRSELLPSSCESEESNESNTSSDHPEASMEESSDDEEILVLRSKRQKEKMRRRRRRKETATQQRIRAKEVKQEEERKEAKMKELLEAEPELSVLSDDSICPVCLDLLHEPFQVEPCGHIFCEPCLRRLGQKNPMNCTCPLCRTKIGFCKHLAATSREIREEYEALYLKRKKFERSTPVFSYPLPWQPGWRNLIRGRPLGGNRFLVRDNRAEVVRAILHQVPYYIPPVMIANLINIGIFAFMMGVIEVFPNLLAIFMGSGKNLSLALNSSLEGELIPETSGDLTVSSLEEGQAESTLDLDPELPGGQVWCVVLG